ncbi:hypothetical protein B296_00039171 [Ensete ventricosum]|uniref:Uncharacterized protein n=1 Tax=Ensete ventricosum TaxID=4639 RepID=A0A426Y0E2_ENSVE|nr:hypothetical protein B296_00039171 [Ensete ventricosum]
MPQGAPLGPADKGKGLVEIKEAPEQGYTIQDLCEVEDWTRADKYLASIMMRLKTVEGEDPLNQHERILALWDANKELKLGANQELVAAAEHRAKELEEDARKLRAKLESLKNQQKGLKQEVGVLRSSLDGARNDRARLKGDVSSLTEVVTLLEAKLKAKGLKALAAYKAS